MTSKKEEMIGSRSLSFTLLNPALRSLRYEHYKISLKRLKLVKV